MLSATVTVADDAVFAVVAGGDALALPLPLLPHAAANNASDAMTAPANKVCLRFFMFVPFDKARRSDQKRTVPQLRPFIAECERSAVSTTSDRRRTRRRVIKVFVRTWGTHRMYIRIPPRSVQRATKSREYRRT